MILFQDETDDLIHVSGASAYEYLVRRRKIHESLGSKSRNCHAVSRSELLYVLIEEFQSFFFFLYGVGGAVGCVQRQFDGY